MKMLAHLLFGALLSSAVIAQPVELKTSSSLTGYKYGIDWQQATFDIVVENIAYEKDVAIHLKNDLGEWVDVAAEYVGSAGENKELWRASYYRNELYDNGPHDLEFAVVYTVDGMTYWDNNNWNNYFVGASDGYWFDSDINVRNISYSTTRTLYPSYQGGYRYTGNIALRNLAYAKDVKVVYSTDGWDTTKTVDASFSPYYYFNQYSSVANPNANGIEIWSYEFPLTEGETQLEYAIVYTVNGMTYWDNNYGDNYSVDITFGQY